MFLSKHSNGTYYLYYSSEQGKIKKVSTHCQYKTDALRFLQSFKSDEYERRQKAKRKLLSEFLKDFLPYAEANFSKGTVAIYRSAIQNFLEISGDLALASYTPQHFDAYKSERLKTIKAVTVNIELRTLRAFFNTAVRWKLLESNPFKIQLVRVPENTPTFITKLEF